MSSAPSKIIDFTKKNRLSIDAKQRLQYDLDTILTRLQKGEYETSGIVENTFDIPGKTEQFYAHLLTFYKIGRSWEAIFKFLQLSNQKLIVDLCPGSAPKVELGLYYAGYSGRVKLFDIDKSALKTLIKFVNLFKINFKLEPNKFDFFRSTTQTYSLVIGNHIFDDLILSYFCTKLKINPGEIYKKESVLFSVWTEILKNEKENKTEITNLFTDRFIAIVKKRGMLLLSNYPGYAEKMFNLNKEFNFTNAVFKEVIVNLTRSNYFKQIIIPKRILTFKDSYFTSKHIVALEKT